MNGFAALTTVLILLIIALLLGLTISMLSTNEMIMELDNRRYREGWAKQNYKSGIYNYRRTDNWNNSG